MKKILLLIFSAFFLISCGDEKFEAKSNNQFLMGTVCIITLYGGESQDIYDGAFSIIEKEDLLMSLQKGNSELSLINNQAGIEKLFVSDDIYEVVSTAVKYARLTGGAFDPTIAPLVELWGIGDDYTGSVPAASSIISAKEMTDYTKIIMEEDHSIFLEKAGMKIDLGGIAKGYIADKVKDYLHEQGVKRGIINLGGNIIVMGNKPESQPWKIGVQNPFDSRGNHIGIAEVADKTIVTSGIYERFFYAEGKRYHHILDPKTGYPVENDLASVTIISDLSIDADALSTSLFILGVEEGLKLIETIENSEALFVTKDKKVIYSSGAEKVFTLYHEDFSHISLKDYLSTS